MSTWVWQHRGVLLWAIPVLVGLGLRMYDTGDSIWGDEAYSYVAAKQSIDKLFSFVAETDPHPPLYYLILHFWMLLGDSELWLRFLSIATGTAAIGVLYAVGKALYGTWGGFVAALLLALSPLHVYQSGEVRMYTVLTLLVTISIWLYLRALQEEKLTTWVLLGVAGAFALSVHYGAVWILIALGLYTVLFLPWRSWILLGGSYILTFFLFLPQLGTFLTQAQGDIWIPFPTDQYVLRMFKDIISHAFPWTTLVVAWTAAILLAAALMRPARPLLRDLPLLLFIVPVILILLASYIQPVFLNRHLIVAVPGLCLLLAHIATAPGARRASLLLIGVLVLMNGISLHRFSPHPSFQDWRAVAVVIKENGVKGDGIYLDRHAANPMGYYIRRLAIELPVIQDDGIMKTERVWYPTISSIPTNEGLKELEKTKEVVQEDKAAGVVLRLYAPAAAR